MIYLNKNMTHQNYKTNYCFIISDKALLFIILNIIIETVIIMNYIENI